jgi:CubicO group peptidase (beta-lactamase class C family)
LATERRQRRGIAIRQTIVRCATLALLSTLLAAGPVVQAADPDPPWPTSGWQVSTPEAQGMASSVLADLVDFGAANEMDSILVERHGKVVLDAYFAPFEPGLKHIINSSTKAIVGTLVGIALQEGKIERLDAPMLGFFPERYVADISARKKAITLQDLLDSTSGLSWHEPLNDDDGEITRMGPDVDWVGFVLDRPMAGAPGISFNYNSGTWHLLSAIVARQGGTDTLEYARQKLFAPLGITDVAWGRSPQGIPVGGSQLFMQPRDMAKIGYLYLHGGQWAGQQLLPPGWTDRVSHAQVDMHLGALRYANGWWVLPKRHAYMAVGLACQLIIVLPEIDTVAVATGRQVYSLAQIVDRIASAATSSAALPPDAAGNVGLADRIAAAGSERRSPVRPPPSLATVVSGKTYRFADNPAGITSLKLDFSGAEPRYELTRIAVRNGPARRLEGPIGLDGTFQARNAHDAEPLLAKGGWASDKSFQLVLRELLEGIDTTLLLSFDGPHVDVSLENNWGFRDRLRGESRE